MHFNGIKGCCMRAAMESLVFKAQDTICEAIAGIDGGTFQEDRWERAEGGGGRSRVLQGGQVFEKAGVNVSVVHGTLSAEAAAKMGGGKELGAEHLTFYATGVSLVLHPQQQRLHHHTNVTSTHPLTRSQQHKPGKDAAERTHAQAAAQTPVH